jgi:hypothetical protein
LAWKDLNDVRLAFFVARLWDGPDGPIFSKFLREVYLPEAQDNCERMIANFWLGEQETALASLVHRDAPPAGSPVAVPAGEALPLAYIPAAAALFDAISPEPSGSLEHANLAHASAYAYATSGAPILALQRCRHLLPGFNPATDAVVSSLRSANIVAALAAGPRSNDSWAEPPSGVQELIEGCGAREPILVAVQLAENYRCKHMLAAQCVATACQGRDEAIRLIWCESRQLLVTLYNLSSTPEISTSSPRRLKPVASPEGLAAWRPRGESWVRRTQEVLRGALWLEEHRQPQDGHIPVAMMNHVKGHALLIAMACALAHHHYQLVMDIFHLEHRLQALGSDSRDPALRAANLPASVELLLDLLDSCLKVVTHAAELERVGATPEELAPSGGHVSLLDVYILRRFQSLVFRIMQEDSHALTLRATQVAACLQVWAKSFETQICLGAGQELPPADELEACVGELGAGAGEVWEHILRHPDVMHSIRFKRHAGWCQVETRWNWAAKSFIIDNGRLGQVDVGEAPPSEDDAVWSALLSNYYADDGGVSQDTPPLWKVELKPTKDGYPEYSFCAKTLEAQKDWLSKLNRHCAQRNLNKSPRRKKAPVAVPAIRKSSGVEDMAPVAVPAIATKPEIADLI